MSTDTEADFPSASTNCLLALIEEDYDRQIIQRYIEVLAADSGDLYWVGYRYDGSLDVVDVNGQPASSVLTNSINFDPSTQDPSPGLCIAIGGDGLFWNLPCTDPQPYVCSVDFTGECLWVCLCQRYKVCVRIDSLFCVDTVFHLPSSFHLCSFNADEACYRLVCLFQAVFGGSKTDIRLCDCVCCYNLM